MSSLSLKTTFNIQFKHSIPRFFLRKIIAYIYTNICSSFCLTIQMPFSWKIHKQSIIHSHSRIWFARKMVKSTKKWAWQSTPVMHILWRQSLEFKTTIVVQWVLSRLGSWILFQTITVTVWCGFILQPLGILTEAKHWNVYLYIVFPENFRNYHKCILKEHVWDSLGLILEWLIGDSLTHIQKWQNCNLHSYWTISSHVLLFNFA